MHSDVVTYKKYELKSAKETNINCLVILINRFIRLNLMGE